MKLSMLQLIKKFLWMGLLAFSLQTSWGFALIGPTANGGDFWQVPEIGYAGAATLIITPGGPVELQDIGSPKNLGEGYRRNVPVLYYAYDANFLKYFGSNGVAAVDSAFAIVNSLTNVDSYSSNLIEFPLQTQTINYQAQALGLTDLKSEALHLIIEQLGLSQPERFTWTLRQRNHEAGAPPCPAGMEYLVIQRNFDITASPLDQLQPSPYVNDTLYTYFIDEVCNPPNPLAITAISPVDPLADTFTAVAANTADGLLIGGFYTGLTRDDVAGLRYLLSSDNITLETAATNSVPVGGGGGLTITNIADEYYTTTSNLTQLILDAKTNNPTALQALYPGLVITSVVSNTFNGTYTYTFGNLITNFFPISTNTLVQIQVQSIGPLIGSPYGSPDVTNTTTTTIMSNILSGAFLLAPTNTCGLDVLQVVATNITTVTNFLGSGTNVSGSITNVVSTNLVFSSTNYTVLVAPCEFINGSGTNGNTTALYEGIEKVQFVRRDFDSLVGQTWDPITNTYTMMAVVNSRLVPVTFQRVVTQPDILFSAGDLADQGGGNGGIGFNNTVQRTDMNFTEDPANVGNNSVAGPGIINSPSVLTFNKVGPIYYNSSDFSFIPDENSGVQLLLWGSFDGTTNAPVVYPDGTSIENLENEVFIQISPQTLPTGTNGVAYSVTLSATGGQSPYTWSLAPNSAGLPPGLTLFSNGVISGIPTETETFDNIVIQMTDSSNPSRSVDINYSLDIINNN
jgi:hypothetical protein